MSFNNIQTPTLNNTLSDVDNINQDNEFSDFGNFESINSTGKEICDTDQ